MIGVWFGHSAVPMLIYATMLWGLGLGGGILLGLTYTFGRARGAPGFFIAAIESLWLVAVYLNGVSRRDQDRDRAGDAL